MRNRKRNVVGRMQPKEFVKMLMGNTMHGGLVHVFVVEAIRFYADAVHKTPVPPKEERKTPIVNPKLWHEIAGDIVELFDMNFKPPKRPEGKIIGIDELKDDTTSIGNTDAPSHEANAVPKQAVSSVQGSDSPAAASGTVGGS